MAALTSTVLILSLNLLFFTLVTSCNTCTPSPNPTKPIRPPTYMPPKSIHHQNSQDTLKLAACADVLNGVVNLIVGTPPNTPCCSLINGLVDLEAAVCLCTALRAQVLGVVNVDVSIDLSLLLNTCGKKVPSGFQCA
ncbi:hypothetical protein MKW92_030876 [Papaver armeniacum]|nr:hypothetical protein MKW92_030876 [Papaver armeniacum]